MGVIRALRRGGAAFSFMDPHTKWGVPERVCHAGWLLVIFSNCYFSGIKAKRDTISFLVTSNTHSMKVYCSSSVPSGLIRDILINNRCGLCLLSSWINE